MLLIAEITYVFSHFLRLKMRLDWVTLDFPDNSDGKESACSAGDSSLIRGLGRSLEEGNGNRF